MLCGTTPFKAHIKEMLMYNITKGNLVFTGKISALAQDLICKMLQRTQESRIGLDKIKDHGWVKLQYDLDNSFEDKNFEEQTAKISITDTSSGKSTKESFCDDFSKKNDIGIELEIAKDSLKNIEEKIQLLSYTKLKLEFNEKKMKQAISDAEHELKGLQETNNFSNISEKLFNTRKIVYDRTRLSNKQKFYLEKLKNKVEEKNKELEEKEAQLASLHESVKRIKYGFSRIKTYKSLDISTLKINLDVIQTRLEYKHSNTFKSEVSIKDVMELIQSNISELKNFPIRECE